MPAQVQHSLLTFPSRSFSCPVTPPLSAQEQTSFLNNDTKVSFLFFSFFLFYPWHPNSDLELQCMQTNFCHSVSLCLDQSTPSLWQAQNSGSRVAYQDLEILALHSQGSLATVRKGMGSRTKSMLRNELMHHVLQGQHFFKCCCVPSKGRKKKSTQIQGVRRSKFLWVQYVPQSGN